MALGLTADALALGVGRPSTQSALGQPLNLLFPIRLNADESLSPDCVHAEVMAGDARVPANLVQLRLEGATEASVRAVRLQSTVQIDEPIVSIHLSVGCRASFTRQFTAFIDPPSAHTLAAPVEPAAAAELVTRTYSPALRAALLTADAKPAALLAQPGAGASLATIAGEPVIAAAVPPAASTPRPGPSSAAPEGAASAPPKSSKPPRRKPGKPAAELLAGARGAQPVIAAGPRLRLDPAEPVEPAAAQPASAPASQAELTAALARLQKLEENLGRMQQESRGTQDKLLALRGQLEQARGERYQNPLVAVLALSVLGLGGAVAYLWRSRRREREVRESVWWNEVQSEQRESQLARLGEASPPPPPPPPPATPMAEAMVAPRAPAPVVKPLEFEEDTMAGTLSDGDERGLPGLAASAAAAVAFEDLAHEPLSIQFVGPQTPMAAGPAPHVTVEELIDLEQQVDFFQVLGQDEAAIELLRARIGTGMASALPYLKLLEIHQRRAEQPAFADLGARFAERFQALPPTWGSDLNEGRRLEAYEAVLRRVQAGWLDSGASMALLQGLLSRGGDDAQGFDLPAYRDLLLLYGVARDLSEHEVRGEQIDLFLPLDSQASGGSGMMATMVWQNAAAPPSNTTIDVDISLDEPAPDKV